MVFKECMVIFHPDGYKLVLVWMMNITYLGFMLIYDMIMIKECLCNEVFKQCAAYKK